MMKAMDGSKYSEYEANKLFGLIDVNGDEKIEFDEFICIFNDSSFVNDEIMIDWLFETIDKDRSGSIEKTELIKFVEDNKVSFNNLEMNELIKDLDADNSGTIDLNEFRVALKKVFGN